MPKPAKPTTVVSGTVDGLNIPAEWTTKRTVDEETGKVRISVFKRCGILLKDCNKPGVSWINYFWNQKNRNGEEQENGFADVRRGQTYNFICTTSVYNDKIQYSPINYELLSFGGGESPRHTEEEGEMEDDGGHPYIASAGGETVPNSIPIPVTVPNSIKAPTYKMVGMIFADENGNIFEARC